MGQTDTFQQRLLPRPSWHATIGPLATLLILLLGLWNLGGPGMWWDEGWTLSVARNWVERGHYGRLLAGEPAPPGMEASFTVTGPVALGMRLFGVGLWQGRIFGVLCAAAALGLVYVLAWQLYSPVVAGGALAVLLLLSMHPQLHPLIQGRQVLAEMPMLCYLFAGYACLLLALRGRWWLLPLVMLCWGTARISKAQIAPFWTIALLVPTAAALLLRRWRTAALLGASLAGSVAASSLVSQGIGLLLSGQTMTGQPVTGIYEVTALVLGWINRQYALVFALTFGLLTLLGLLHGAWAMAREPRALLADVEAAAVRLSLLALAGSWFGWYLLLSVGVPRYLFPATFVGSIFAAAMLHELTGGFSLASTLRHAGAALTRLRLSRQGLGALLALVLAAMGLALTGLTYQRFYFAPADDSAARVAAFFNTATPPNTLIETYESELHFLLDRPYHYPPDQVHVELNRRGLLHQEVAIDYDPLAADPDYLVVGVFSRGNRLYQPALDAGAFRLVQQVGDYEIYERVR